MSDKIHVNNYEEGYALLAEKLDLPFDANDTEARIAFAKNLIKMFVEL